jgi:hypothetical protein
MATTVGRDAIHGPMKRERAMSLPPVQRPARRPPDWASIAEAATMARVPGDAEAARTAFRSLPNYEQMQLARELVTTRQAEIARAYEDVICLSPGYRLRGSRRRWIEPDVCVILVVRKKWTPRTRGPVKRRVPAELFVYATIRGRRVLCAVPTDVEDGPRLSNLRPQVRIEAFAPQRGRGQGAIACAVVRGNDPAPYAIGCRHVFGGGTGEPGGATIRLAPVGATIASVVPTAGILDNAPADSFDGQLALVTDERLLMKALDGILAEDFALGWEEFRFGVDYWIHTPDGPIRARFVSQFGATITYSDALDGVQHIDLARFLLPESATQPGHSGSPILTRETGGRLVGMHVIGDALDTSLAIPAWRLLDPASYGIDKPETWTLWRGPGS